MKAVEFYKRKRNSRCADIYFMLIVLVGSRQTRDENGGIVSSIHPPDSSRQYSSMTTEMKAPTLLNRFPLERIRMFSFPALDLPIRLDLVSLRVDRIRTIAHRLLFQRRILL